MRGGVKLLLLIIGGILALAVAGFIIWAVMLPESGVKMANEMDSYALDYLDQHRILNATEKLICYYDATLAMDGTEAALVTTERVLYHKQGRTTALLLAEVTDVQHHYESLIGDVILVQGASGESMKIEIAPMNGGPAFLNALRNVWQQAAPGPPAAPANP